MQQNNGGAIFEGLGFGTCITVRVVINIMKDYPVRSLQDNKQKITVKETGADPGF